jgi:hypothetical protein
MQIRLVRAEEHTSLIEELKQKLSAEEYGPDAQADDETRQAQPIAQYLVAFGDDGTVMGMAEAFFEDQTSAGYHEMRPVEMARALEERCPFEKLAIVSMMYVEPEFRRRPTYAYLALGISHLLRELGALGSLCLMDDGNAALHRLYIGTGGERIATYRRDDQKRTLSAYYFARDTTCSHPVMKRALRHCDIDMELARDTYNWKYGPQEYQDELEDADSGATLPAST